MKRIYNYEALNYAAETLGSFKGAFEKYKITTEEAKANFIDGGVIAKAIQLFAEDNFCNYEHIAQVTFGSSLTFEEIRESFKAVESYDEVDSNATFEEDIQDKIYNYQVKEMIKHNSGGVRNHRNAIARVRK